MYSVARDCDNGKVNPKVPLNLNFLFFVFLGYLYFFFIYFCSEYYSSDFSVFINI